MLLYTDGLIDAMDFEGRLWGKEKLLKTLKDCPDHNADTILRNILTYRRRFVGLARQIDDTSIVAIKVDKNTNRK
jgi:sigma-B regulation protein RsbU (phosphoserine phosphatase)